VTGVRSIHTRLIKLLGSVGYVAIALQWLLVLMAWLPKFAKSGIGKTIFPQSSAPAPLQQSPVSTSTAGPDFVTVFLVTCMAFVVIGAVMYVVFVRYTRAVSNAGSKTVHEFVKRSVPLVAHRPIEKLPAKKRIVLTRRMLFWTKVVAALIPTAILPIALHDGSRGIAEWLALCIQTLLATCAVIAFFAQALLVQKWHTQTDQVN